MGSRWQLQACISPGNPGEPARDLGGTAIRKPAVVGGKRGGALPLHPLVWGQMHAMLILICPLYLILSAILVPSGRRVLAESPRVATRVVQIPTHRTLIVRQGASWLARPMTAKG
jgi:hypothetical protein